MIRYIDQDLTPKRYLPSGFVNRFLSWKGFQPLSRLTYVAYLFHYDYLNAYAASNRRQMYYTIRESITIYFGVLVTVFAIAFVVSATIEASFLNLEKLLFVPINKTNGILAFTQHVQIFKDVRYFSI